MLSMRAAERVRVGGLNGATVRVRVQLKSRDGVSRHLPRQVRRRRRRARVHEPRGSHGAGRPCVENHGVLPYGIKRMMTIS